MNLILRGIIRHTGYASLVLAGVCLLAELVMPAFVTPYFNPYVLVVFGMMLSAVGVQGVSGTRSARWVWGAVFGLGVGLAFWFSFGDASRLLMGGGVAMLIAFLVTSVYAFDV